MPYISCRNVNQLMERLNSPVMNNLVIRIQHEITRYV